VRAANNHDARRADSNWWRVTSAVQRLFPLLVIGAASSCAIVDDRPILEDGGSADATKDVSSADRGEVGSGSDVGITSDGDGDGSASDTGSPDSLRDDAMADRSVDVGADGDSKAADVTDAFDGGSPPSDAVAEVDAGCPLEAYVAVMDGSKVPIPVSTTSTGTTRVVVQRDCVTLSYTVHLSMQTPSDLTMAHIHRAAPGMNGPIVATFFSPDPPDAGPDFAGAVTLMPSDVTLLRSGDLYADAHSHTYPAGEIRGWFAKE
jgi:hypothetical protein